MKHRLITTISRKELEALVFRVLYEKIDLGSPYSQQDVTFDWNMVTHEDSLGITLEVTA